MGDYHTDLEFVPDHALGNGHHCQHRVVGPCPDGPHDVIAIVCVTPLQAAHIYIRVEVYELRFASCPILPQLSGRYADSYDSKVPRLLCCSFVRVKPQLL